MGAQTHSVHTSPAPCAGTGAARARVRQALALVRCALEAVSPEHADAAEVAEMLAVLGDLERLVRAAMVRFARGTPDPAGMLSRAAGSARGAARRQVERAGQLAATPDTERAFSRGEVSLDQAEVIAPVEAALPDAATELVALAKRSSLRSLQAEAARRLRRIRPDEEEVATERRLHARRFCRAWTLEGGAVRLEAQFDRVDGARMLYALQRATDRLAREAAGVPEPRERLCADALVELVTTDRGRPGPVELVVQVDAGALRRGEVGPGEVCEIPGIGPISVAAARSLLGDAFLTVVVRDGADIATVTSRTRVIPRRVRSALEARDPFCVVPGCAATQRLEIDHWRLDFARFGPTELANLCRLCPTHHRMKTRDGWRLRGGPGRWEWLPPRGRPGGPPPP